MCQEVDYPRLESVCTDLLLAIGEDPEREGLRETPRRFASAWKEFIDYRPGTTDTSFQSVTTDQLVIVSGLRVWSFCEHHLLPFWADISIGYIAQDRVLGLSKFARIAQKYAHKLQLQERLCDEIATDVAIRAKTESVAVLARGEHLCMTMRGIKAPALMTSSVMRGQFRDNPELRLEFLHLTTIEHAGGQP